MSSPDYSSLGFKDLVVSLDGAVAVISMNRPTEQRKTLNNNVVNELLQAFDLCNKDDRVRVVILTADPSAPSYCTGVDISGGWDHLWDEDAANEGDQAHRDPGGIISLLVYNCRKITVAAVNGHAAGGGATALQLPFDFRFVWAGTKIKFPFVRRGVSAEAASTYLLPRLLGHSRATSLLLTGATVTPDSPAIRDLYHQILPTREEVLPVAKVFAEELAANTSQPSVAYTKALLQHPGDSIEENHLLDSRAIRILAQSSDAMEGAVAFKERRRPVFTDTLSSNPDPWSPWWRSLDIRHLKSKL